MPRLLHDAFIMHPMHSREKIIATLLATSLCLNAILYFRREPSYVIPSIKTATASNARENTAAGIPPTPEPAPISIKTPSDPAQVAQYGLWFFDPSHLPKEIRNIRSSNGAMANGRKLTDTVARIVGLDSTEKKQSQLALDEAFLSAESLLLKNIRPASDSEPGLDEFVVTANPESATHIFSQLSASLTNFLGESKARNLLNSIDFNQYFAGMGTLDARISFEDIPEDPDNPSSALHTHVKYTLRNPRSGGVAFASGGFFEGLSERFGTMVFERATQEAKNPASKTR